MKSDEEAIRARIQSYLKDVAGHLGGMPEPEQRDLLRQLESHAHEALQARTRGREATVSDVAAVLAEMDPPESYETKPKSLLHGLSQGKWALLIGLGSLMLAGVVMLLSGGRVLLWIPFFLFLGGQIAAFVIGILSWRESFGKAAVFTSAGLTAVSLLFCA